MSSSPYSRSWNIAATVKGCLIYFSRFWPRSFERRATTETSFFFPFTRCCCLCRRRRHHFYFLALFTNFKKKEKEKKEKTRGASCALQALSESTRGHCILCFSPNEPRRSSRGSREGFFSSDVVVERAPFFFFAMAGGRSRGAATGNAGGNGGAKRKVSLFLTFASMHVVMVDVSTVSTAGPEGNRALERKREKDKKTVGCLFLMHCSRFRRQKIKKKTRPRPPLMSLFSFFLTEIKTRNSTNKQRKTERR